MRSLYLSALGIVNSLGSSQKEIFNNLIQGKAKSVQESAEFLDGKAIPLGLVLDKLPQIPPHLKSLDIRCNQLLLASYSQIENEVQEAIKKYGKNRIAVIIGSGTSGIDETEKATQYFKEQQKHPEDFNFNFLEMGSPAKFLAKYLGLTGIFYTVSTACSSSAKAFLSAQNLIDMDLCDAVLLGGSDNLCKLTVGGFNALEAVSDKICNPMSKNRDGITLGEASALFLLTKEPNFVEKSENIKLLGVGESSDAYHATSPDPKGEGAFIAMKNALEKAQLKPSDIDYINLHGTATQLNDKMESAAVHNLFEDKTHCSSTKPLTGHTLGCAGITEVALCWLILSNLNQNNFLPPHLWDEEFDPELPQLNLVKNDGKNSLKKLSICMSNSFAFGGSNSSVIIGKNCKI